MIFAIKLVEELPECEEVTSAERMGDNSIIITYLTKDNKVIKVRVRNRQIEDC